MGCGQTKTFEDDKTGQLKITKMEIHEELPDLKEKILEGHLEGNFRNCLITNEKELEDNLISYIPTKIEDDKNPGQLTHNIHDDIITQSVEFNFEKHNIIALSGFRTIIKVEEYKGNYLVFYDSDEGNYSKYIVIFVKKISGFPQIQLVIPI